LDADNAGDEEYLKFKEEETNSKKMSTILKNLNAPFKRNKFNKPPPRSFQKY
jgi:hypothetical protein